MGGMIINPAAKGKHVPSSVPFSLVCGLLDTFDGALLVVDRSGRLLYFNARARQCFPPLCDLAPENGNFFLDLLGMDAQQVFRRIEAGDHQVELEVVRAEKKYLARVRWLPEPDWLTVQIAPEVKIAALPNAGTQVTVQELLQEREITYRNLLAAYLKLQEVNRQKTVFLASAAHELKTPLAVIKGYYDLLLTGSLGRLNEKQQDIVEESKDSCERLVRLVSMFLNYSALESGKLILQLRENDLRDCLDELAKRWSEAFQRKGVKLETQFDPSVPNFKFDYQKVQQAAANLLDNSLKHTPAGGSVTLRAAPAAGP